MAFIALFPVLISLFLAGAALGLTAYFMSPRDRRPSLALILAAPFGCVALLVMALALLILAAAFLATSDTQLYEEVFGHPPPFGEDRMLFDDFGRGAGREIFMRAEPTNAERNRLLAAVGAVPSDYTLEEFRARGDAKGFMWWLSVDPSDTRYCKAARIYDAHGYRGWIELRIAHCIEALPGPAGYEVGNIYVIASGRPSAGGLLALPD